MQSLITQTKEYVKWVLSGEGSGHDWWHVYRVWKNAMHIADKEVSVDKEVVELAALLHDIADHKFHDGDTTVGPARARDWLLTIETPSHITDHVCEIISTLSFKGAGVPTNMSTQEGMIVQDADRLDAIGAIGIARTFAYGGYAGQEMYDPALQPVLHDSFEAYQTQKTTTINHFYEKLLLLKDRLNTETARKMAAERHHFMEVFLRRFFKEWEGEV